MAWALLATVFWGQIHWSLFAGVLCYSTLAGLFLGTLMGCVVAVNNSLGSLQQVFQLTLEITQHVNTDVARLRDGSTRLPSARETIRGVYHSVVLPTVEGVMLGQSKLLGRPAFCLYRSTLGRAMEIFIDDLTSDGVIIDAAYEVPDVEEPFAIVDSAYQITTGWIAQAQQHVERTGMILRRLVLVPLSILLGLCVVVASVPVIAMWYLA